MWYDDGDFYSYHNRDQENWERARDDQAAKVQCLIDLLIDLKVIKIPDGQFNLGTHWGHDITGFVDRHWRV